MNNLIDGKHNYSLHPMFVAGPDGELGSHSRRAICRGWARALQVAHISFRFYLFGQGRAHIFQISLRTFLNIYAKLDLFGRF